ncbi:LysR family transcriptional regulator [Roseovarius aestuariivivens]|uniref:LysR family transcriptional regulator n=1 Tax=Roseovarius aestuariivivens TaxID=1888910 RepID=UPI00143692D1|nr:LysR family transcriptional regulator [Roseovarius aestuariivivens]
MTRSTLSLKGLEVFQAVACGGSLQEAARRLGLSISTVSHHLGGLEKAVGVALIDHRRRPLRLTSEGETLLARVDESLGLLRKGMAEVVSKEPGTLVRALRLALIEDLDAQVTPALAARLSRDLRSCDLSFRSRPSHDILTLLQTEEIDIGIASAAEFRATRLDERPLLRDPYVLVAPRGQEGTPDAFLRGASRLPLLRYSRKQLMGRRIEAQLRRLRLDIPARLEFESTPAILSMVAEGQAWTITTALNVASAGALVPRLRVLPFPDAGFVRPLSVFHAEAVPHRVVSLFEATVRPLLRDRVIAPTVAQVPWLAPDFRLLTG